jgi:hypothetical protein
MMNPHILSDLTAQREADILRQLDRSWLARQARQARQSRRAWQPHRLRRRFRLQSWGPSERQPVPATPCCVASAPSGLIRPSPEAR